MSFGNVAQKIIGYFDLNERAERGMAEAGKQCHVPFKSGGSRPVYCCDKYRSDKPPKRI